MPTCLRRYGQRRHRGTVHVLRGRAQRRVFFDFDGVKNLFDTSGGRNSPPRIGRQIAVDRNRLQHRSQRLLDGRRVPTSELGGNPGVRIWGRCSVRNKDGILEHVDRAGHPSVSSFFNTDETKLEYNASEPVSDYKRWLEMFVHLMGHTGNYTREEAIAAIDEEGILPDMLSYDPTKPAKYPNGAYSATTSSTSASRSSPKATFRPRASRRTPTRCRSSRISVRLTRRAEDARRTERAGQLAVLTGAAVAVRRAPANSCRR